VVFATSGIPLTTRETVWYETPERAPTCAMVILLIRVPGREDVSEFLAMTKFGVGGWGIPEFL
jgi:hypothetical protein